MVGLHLPAAMLSRRVVPAVLAAAALAAAAAPARAVPYEAFVDVEDQDDLDDLLATGQLTPESHDALRALLDRGVDLDTADREELYALPNLTYADVDAILAYRALNGFIANPADLVVAGALTEEKLLAIAAFVIVREREVSAYQPHGFVRLFTRASQNDDTIPPLALRARVKAGRNLTAGLAAALHRRQLGAVVWDPNRDGLLADAPAVRPEVPKLFARYKGDQLDVIAGTYRIGFGQRLTFDTALDYTPNGIYLDDQISRSYDLTRDCIESTGELGAAPCAGARRYEYVTPDFDTSEGLRGVAAGVEHVPLGDGTLQAYGWASYQTRSLYQYELVDRGACADPRADSQAACAAPDVFVRPAGGLLTPTAELSYQTLPDMFAEALVGGNVTYFASRRDFVGITGYGASIDWLAATPAGVELDFQEWARFPTGGAFGAIGANLGVGRGLVDVFAEVTHSFDKLTASGGPVGGGGGPAAIVRATHTRKKQELELSLRYYDPDFVNPYAGAIASPDEVEGQRARGEHGARVRYTAVHGQVGVRAGLDLWRSLAEVPLGMDRRDWVYIPRGDVYVRTDIAASKELRWGVWLRYQDKGLDRAGGTPCFEIPFDDGEIGEPVTCYGNKLTSTARLHVAPDRTVAITAQAQHELLDDSRTELMGAKRHDLSALLTAVWKPTRRVRLTGRARYLNEDISDNGYLEQSLRTYAELMMKLRAKDSLRVRGDVVLYLDDRSSTSMRTPSPELWLGLDYEARF